MEQLNANIHYQIFCGIRINSRNPLTNYKLIDDIVLKLSNRLKVQNQQEALAEALEEQKLRKLMTDDDREGTDAAYKDASTITLWEKITKSKVLLLIPENIFLAMIESD